MVGAKLPPRIVVSLGKDMVMTPALLVGTNVPQVCMTVDESVVIALHEVGLYEP